MCKLTTVIHSYAIVNINRPIECKSRRNSAESTMNAVMDTTYEKSSGKMRRIVNIFSFT